jgi:Lon protease-like protein
LTGCARKAPRQIIVNEPVNPENDPDPTGKFPEEKAGHALSSQEMPLFPLDLVLFPHMAIPLHIFEERYKEMINLCVEESLPFGIVLATGMSPGTGKLTTHQVGCTARIARVERMADGKMNIEVVGERRFRILDTHETRSYRTGLTEPVVDVPLIDDVDELADEVQRLLRDFLTRSLARMGQSVDDFVLPDEPVPLSFMAACVLPIENEEKQALLEETDTEARLAVEKEVLLREVTRLRRSAETAAEISSEPLEWHPVKAERFAELLSLN